MSRPPYRSLRIGLRVVSILIAVAGLLMIFGNRPLILRMFLHPPESEVSTLLLLTPTDLVVRRPCHAA